MSYIDTIKARARLDKKTIVLPETTDKRTLIAAAKIMEEGIANIIMIGDEEKIMDGAGWLEVDLTGVKSAKINVPFSPCSLNCVSITKKADTNFTPTGVKVINPKNTEKLDEYVNLLYETRKSKGMTPEKDGRSGWPPPPCPPARVLRCPWWSGSAWRSRVWDPPGS